MADAAAKHPAADVTRAPMQEWTRFPLYLSQIVGTPMSGMCFFVFFLCIFVYFFGSLDNLKKKAYVSFIAFPRKDKKRICVLSGIYSKAERRVCVLSNSKPEEKIRICVFFWAILFWFQRHIDRCHILCLCKQALR